MAWTAVGAPGWAAAGACPGVAAGQPEPGGATSWRMAAVAAAGAALVIATIAAIARTPGHLTAASIGRRAAEKRKRPDTLSSLP